MNSESVQQLMARGTLARLLGATGPRPGALDVADQVRELVRLATNRDLLARSWPGLALWI